MTKVFIFLFFILNLFAKQKALHISFHEGCIGEVKKVCRALNMDLDSWNVLNSDARSFNGKTPNSHNYIMSHENADMIFKKHRKTFGKYDLIIVSDIAPLCRIFLQNYWRKPLIVWVCNRFDFNARSSGDEIFPDQEYLSLFQNAGNLPNVEIVGYTKYESYHAKKNRGITSIKQIINPTGLNSKPSGYKPISKEVDKKDCFFARRYINEYKLNIWSILSDLGISNYGGTYAGSADLKGFKGMIHIPCVMSNLHLFENAAQGIIHYIPSKAFYRSLYESEKIDFYDWTCANKRCSRIPVEEIFNYSDWYRDDLAPLFVFFDSFDEIPELEKNLDIEKKKEVILKWSKAHIEDCLSAWRGVFKKVMR